VVRCVQSAVSGEGVGVALGGEERASVDAGCVRERCVL
jgi:hypothetical protein